jgi:hypothetical protein
MKHLEFEKLVDGFEGFRLPLDDEKRRREVSEHLRECEECAARAAKLEIFFRYVKADKNAEVSQADTAALLNIFKPKGKAAAAASGRGSKIKRLLASLMFDDWQMVLQERLNFSDSRQLLYRAGEFEVDLRLDFAVGGNGSGGSCQVSGQVFPDCGSSAVPAASAELYSAAAGATGEKVFLNDCGEFVFPPLKEGIYNFRLSSGETTIEIENLSLVSN